MPVDLATWTNGPLPDPQMEQLALLLFADRYAMADWAEPRYSVERNHYRKLAIQVRIHTLLMDRWTIEDAHERVAQEVQQLVFGDRRLGPTIRQEVLDYSETFIADAWGHFSKRLFYPAQVDANAHELAQEDARG